ncbi:MAG: Na+/H+ antiporter NhaC family protein [Alteromonadaceae bacterium]|jgi:tetracycline resistance efflux pump|tara:strand:- start:421 stop:1779 length:1359 start_codon:yes stop_codon:yes gene_type:complete
MQDSVITLLPPLIAITIAIWQKNAFFALLAGLLLCHIMIANWQPIDGFIGSINELFGVFNSLGNIYIITFSLLIGALVKLMTQSGAVNGFIQHLSELKLVKNKRHASMLPTIIGTSIFTDTNLSMFTGGMASQQLFDKHKLSRARLAYLLDSTCAPISILFLINGWGAYILGLLDEFNFKDPVGILMGTVGYNFYAIIAVTLAYYTAYSGKVYGPMKRAGTYINIKTEPNVEKVAQARVMWLPLISLLAISLLLLFITGDGDIRRGSGSFSVFWAITSALFMLIAMILYYRLLTSKQIFLVAISGIKTMIAPVSILVISFAFGGAIKELGTGIYVSQLMNVEVPLFLMAPILFIAAAIMAFATGTSWGTWAILVPIAVPIALESGLPIHFLVASVLGGGIFGDHASPISDTTIVASIASGCDHFEHVNTQLPYALFGGIVTLVLYTLIGLSF